MKIRVVACVVAGLLTFLFLTFGADAFQKSVSDSTYERLNRLESDNQALVVKLEEMARLRESIKESTKELTDLKLEMKELKTSFTLVYGALTFIGGLIAVQLVQKFLSNKKAEDSA